MATLMVTLKDFLIHHKTQEQDHGIEVAIENCHRSNSTHIEFSHEQWCIFP